MSGTVSAGLDVTALTLEEFHRSEQDIIQTEERDTYTSYQGLKDRFSKLFQHFDLDREEDGEDIIWFWYIVLLL